MRSSHAVARRSDGSLWAWGDGSGGQLGLGSTTDQLVPVRVGAANSWTSVSAGASHTATLRTDGSLWTWGDNYYGQLGDGTTTSPAQSRPHRHPRPGRPCRRQTATPSPSGRRHAVGSGYNGEGQLGDGTTTSRTTPTQAGTWADWTSVDGGHEHTAGLRGAGTLEAWGGNVFGQIGDGSNTPRPSPVLVGGGDWIAIAAGEGHAVAFREDGTIWAWGDNTCGQLGDGATSTGRRRPTVGEETDSAAVIAGGPHTVAVRADGTVWAWGYNNLGQLGDGTTTERLLPGPGRPLQHHAVAAGYAHSAGAQARTAPCGPGATTATASWATAPPPNGSAGPGRHRDDMAVGGGRDAPTPWR